MRSSKARSRSKQNRSRSVGNIINRVFDSSGPEGKVRGTPQQIIDKYNQLARDAALANDRVAAENFQQHSEHYTRLLGEAMRELEAQRQSGPQSGGHGWGGQDGNGQQNANQNGNGQGGQGQGGQPQYGQGGPSRSRSDEGAEPSARRNEGDSRAEGEAADAAAPQPEARAAATRSQPRPEPRPQPARDETADATGTEAAAAPSAESGPARRQTRGRPAAKPAPAGDPPAGVESLPAFVTQGGPRRARPSSEGPLPVADLDEPALAAPTLVETPEDAPRPRAPVARKPRAPRAPRPAAVETEPAAKSDSAAG